MDELANTPERFLTNEELQAMSQGTFTQKYCGEVKEKLRISSDYALAKALILSQTAVSNYVHGRAAFGDDVSIKVAQILEIPKEIVLAAAAVDRTHSSPSINAAWASVYTTLRSIKGLQAGFANAEILVLIAILSIATPALLTGFFGFFAPNVCILC